MQTAVDIDRLLLRSLCDCLSPKDKIQLKTWRKASPANEARFQQEGNLDKLLLAEGRKFREWSDLGKEYLNYLSKDPILRKAVSNLFLNYVTSMLYHKSKNNYEAWRLQMQEGAKSFREEDKSMQSGPSPELMQFAKKHGWK